MMGESWPLPKRKKFLAELSKGKAERTHPVPFQGKMQHLPIRTVPLDLPLYRLENGRTTDRQAEYLADHPELPDDFFRSDLESKVAQSAQHTLLLKLARERKKNLVKEFESEDQTEPIIMSHTGFVINGNRRLATWRFLYQSDPKKHERFKSIDVVVLPFCDERELDSLEATLQLKEDLKADYSWTAKALMYREKRNSHRYTEDEISSIYDVDVKELRELFDCLDYADAYLESRDRYRHYSEIDNKEYAFRQICRTRKRLKTSEAHKEVFERAAFCLADEAGEGQRTYSEIKKVGDIVDQVAVNLSVELEIGDRNNNEEERLNAVADALAQPKHFEDARLIIRDTLESDSARKRHKRKVDFVSNQIQKALENLEAAKDGIDKKSSRQGCAENLSRISKLVSELESWVAADGR